MQLGDGWQEELASAIPAAPPPRVLAGLDSVAVAALHKSYAAFYDDPLTFLVGQWIAGKGAQSAARAAASEFTSRRFVGITPAAASTGAASSASVGFVPTMPSTTGPHSSTASSTGPVIAWLHRAGLDTGPLLALGHRFEQAALVRPPQLDVSVHLPQVSLELTDAQVGDSSVVLSFSLPRTPAAIALCSSAASYGSDLSLRSPPALRP